MKKSSVKYLSIITLVAIICLSNLNILKASELNSEYPYPDGASPLTIDLIENGYLDWNKTSRKLQVTDKYVNYLQSQNPDAIVINNGSSVDIISTDQLTFSTRSVKNGGVTRLEPKWFGFTLLLDHNTCEEIARRYALGASMASLVAAFIPVSQPIAGMLAAVIAVQAALISANDKGNGIGMNILWSINQPLVGVPIWMWSQ